MRQSEPGAAQLTEKLSDEGLRVMLDGLNTVNQTNDLKEKKRKKKQ